MADSNVPDDSVLRRLPQRNPTEVVVPSSKAHSPAPTKTKRNIPALLGGLIKSLVPSAENGRKVLYEDPAAEKEKKAEVKSPNILISKWKSFTNPKNEQTIVKPSAADDLGPVVEEDDVSSEIELHTLRFWFRDNDKKVLPPGTKVLFVLLPDPSRNLSEKEIERQTNNNGVVLFRKEDAALLLARPFDIFIDDNPVVESYSVDVTKPDHVEKITYDINDYLGDITSDETEIIAEAGEKEEITEVKEGPVEEKPGAETVVVKKTRSIPALYIVALAIIALLGILGFAYYSAGGFAGNDAFTETYAPPSQNFAPSIDLRTTPTNTPVQAVLVIIAVSVMGLVLADRKVNNEIPDFVVMIGSIILIFIGYLILAWSFYTYTIAKQNLGFTFSIEGIRWILAWVAILTTFALMAAAARQGRRDNSIWGGYWGIMGLSGMVLGYLGAFQEAFRVPTTGIFPFSSVWAYIQLKQWKTAEASLIVYGMLVMAISAHVSDVMRKFSKTKKLDIWHAGTHMVWQIIRLLAPPLFFVFMHFVNLLSPSTVYLSTIILSLVCGYFDTDVEDRPSIGQEEGIPVPVGVVTFGRATRFGFDTICVHLEAIALYIAFTGHL
jgi:hypothetical protein